MDTEKLQKIGLNMNEAKVYLALLKIGSGQAGKVSKESQINRTTTYDSLERLIEKGLVTFVIEANKKVFRPVAPERLLDQVKEREKTIHEILPELNSVFKESKEKEESDIFRGRKGIKSILQDILNYKEYIAFGSSGRFLEIMKHDFEIFQKQKKELKIDARVILSKSSRNTEQVKIAYTKFRYIKDEFSSPTTTFVYDDKTAIIVWSETPIATLITSKEVADSYRKYFELLWKEATP
jgi:sugar-specific transcriptional regulator TrmB